MNSHFHLGVQLTEPNLSEGMKWLQGTWIRRFNEFRRIVGRPFQGRYQAILVEPGEHFARVCNYIHLNPVRAGIVSAERIVEYPWSSLPKWTRPTRPEWLCPLTVLQGTGGLSDSPAGWSHYIDFLKFLTTNQDSLRELVSAKLSRGWCLGSTEFRQAMHITANEQKLDLAQRSYAGLSPEDLRHAKQHAWELKLQALARAAGIQLKHLPALKSHPNKAALAAAMKLSTSVSNAWLADRLAMGKPASASQFSRRWLLDSSRLAATHSLLSRVKT